MRSSPTPSFYAFYKTRLGRIMRRMLRKHLRRTINACGISDTDTNPHARAGAGGQKIILGCGYTMPYLSRSFDAKTRCMAVMNASENAHNWSYQSLEKKSDVRAVKNMQKNAVCVSQYRNLPIESQSIDAIVGIHIFEFSSDIDGTLKEFYRVLKPSGIGIFVIPMRGSRWSRDLESPFGGLFDGCAPFTHEQAMSYVEQAGFTVVHIKDALFFPPSYSKWLLRLVGGLEFLGRFMPFFRSGVMIVSVIKRPFSGTAVKADAPKASAVVGALLNPVSRESKNP